MPLCWAHAEYLTLVRSAKDGCGFDCFPQVQERYAKNKTPNRFEIWTLGHQPPKIQSGKALRIITDSPGTIRWTFDDWKTVNDTELNETAIGLSYADLATTKLSSGSKIIFSFRWLNKWEGQNFAVEIA